MLSAICAAVAGLMLSGFSFQATLEMGNDFLLPSINAGSLWSLNLRRLCRDNAGENCVTALDAASDQRLTPERLTDFYAHGMIRRRSTPLWRYQPGGDIPRSLHTMRRLVLSNRTIASKPGPVNPRELVWKGAGGCEIVSHSRQEKRSRTVWITFHCFGMTSSVSVMSLPSFESLLEPRAKDKLRAQR